MSRLSMDLKVMPKSQKGHKYVLCVIDEVTNFLITIPIFHAKSEEVGEAMRRSRRSTLGACYNKILYT